MKPLMLALFVALASTHAVAEEYNLGTDIPADAQALINRIQADIAHRGADEGFYGSYEDDCSSLNIGANTQGNAPDQQVIVADTIINIGGRCRVVRSQAGFMGSAGTTPDNTLVPSFGDDSEKKPVFE